MMNKGKSVEAGVANSNTPVPAAGGSSGSRSAGASGGFGSNYDWRGQGPGGLGADVAGMSASQAAETISERARQRPDLPGNDQMAPTAQQWGDAALIGTDITGMSRGQAGAALDAHMGWFQARESGGKADGSGGQASRSYPATSQAPAGSRGGGVTVTGGGVNVKDTQGSGGAMPEQGSGPAQESGKATGTNGGGMNPKYSGFDAQGESWVQHRLALLKSGKSLGPS